MIKLLPLRDFMLPFSIATHFSPMSHLYTPWKRLGGIEIDWVNMA